jgi:cell fate (sporulation/competence/biofilm development) regulator YlbF (YheA/YmcA/DUF963 family)
VQPITIELKKIINQIEEYEKELKTKQELLAQEENQKQQTMINIFQLQGAIQALKDLEKLVEGEK